MSKENNTIGLSNFIGTSVQTGFLDQLEKSKYIRRTGEAGNYKYEYAKPKKSGKDSTFISHGKEYKTITFTTDKEANDFMMSNKDENHKHTYGVIGERNGMVHLAKVSDLGKDLSKKDEGMSKFSEKEASAADVLEEDLL